MPTKYNHRKFYIKPEHRKSLGKFNIQTGMIITFKYKDAERDKRPLVFVMDSDEFVKKENKKISGINLNYLPISYLNKFFIRMLEKVGWEFDRYTKLPKVDLWDEENPGMKPNIIYDQETTERRQISRQNSIPRNKGVILESERIVDKNTRITNDDLQKLNSLSIAMDDKYRIPNQMDVPNWEHVIESYRHYYLEGKWRFAEWRNDRRPEWWPVNHINIRC